MVFDVFYENIFNVGSTYTKFFLEVLVLTWLRISYSELLEADWSSADWSRHRVLNSAI